MSNLTISNLTTTGSELFQDSEGFMDELNGDICEQLNGGLVVCTFPPINFPPIFPGPFGPYTPMIL